MDILGSLYGKILAIPLGPARALNVELESMRFYERGHQIVAREVRQYKTLFPQQTTRYVICEIGVRKVRWQPTRLYELTYCTYKPDGSLQQENRRDWVISLETHRSWNTMGWGWGEPGYWTPGQYQAQVLLNGVEVARNRYTIEPPPPPKPPAEVLLHPRVQFYASGRETIRFPQQTTREVICELTVRNLQYGQQGRNYPVTVQCSTVEGRLLWEDKRYWWITSQEQEPKMSWSVQTSGWRQGIYHVEIFIEGKQFAWGVFTIE